MHAEVKATRALCTLFERTGQNLEAFCFEFRRWKARGEAGEYDSYLFGKDGAYSQPRFSTGRPGLRHVHLAPLADVPARIQWDRQWRLRTRKTSDRALVYTQDRLHGFLLIFVLQEPHAHAIAQMTTPQDRELMGKFIKIAERFADTGKVIG